MDGEARRGQGAKGVLGRFCSILLRFGWLWATLSTCPAADEIRDLTQFRPVPGGIAPQDVGSVEMSDWLVIGPFQTTTEAAWTVDYLKAETGLGQADNFSLASLKSGYRRQGTPSTRAAAGSASTILDFHQLFGMQRETNGVPAVAYAFAAFHASEPRTGWLLVSSSDGAQIWLNGKLLRKDDTRHGLHRFDEAVRVSLNAGENVLVCRIPKFGTGWGVTARFESDIARATLSALLAQDTLQPLLLKNACIPNGTPLEIAPRGVPRGVSLAIRIRNAEGKVVQEQTVTIGDLVEHTLPSGYYSLEVGIAGRWFLENFIVGSPEEVARALELVPRLRRKFAERGESRDFEALPARFSFLTDPAVHGPSKRDRQWERSAVYLIGEMIDVLRRDAEGTDPFAHVPGLHLRGFRSRIDGLPQYYRIFVPATYDRTKASRLVLLMPTTISANRPFIESVFLRYQIEAERTAVIAERYNTILVWPGYRNQPKGMPCELTHLDEVLEATESEYNIDKNAVCLIGACSGGALGTQAIAKWPERFAGFAVLNPMFGLGSASAFAVDQFASFPDFKPWRSGRTAVPEFLHLRDMRTLVVHDGGEPGHGDLRATESFVTLGSFFGAHIELLRITQGLSQHFDAWNQILAWCSARRRPDSSSKAANIGDDHRVVSVFESRFVVVVGTGGTEAERAANRAAAERFGAQWRQTHFGDCHVLADTEVQSDDERAANLVLIGTPSTNRIWERCRLFLNVTVDDGGISLNGEKVAARLGPYHILCRDSRCPSRKILLMGIVDQHTAPGGLNLTYDGWYTYAVWSPGPEARPIAAGLGQ